MKIAASTLHLLNEPLENILNKLVELPVKRIELADSGKHALNPRIVERLQELASNYNLEYSIHAPYADTNLAADDDLIREWILKRIRASIRFSSELDAECLVLHPGWTTATEPFSRGRSWELNLRSLHWLMRYAGEYGVDCLMENVPNPTPYLLVTVDDFDLFDEEMEPSMSYVLDVAHAHLQSEEYRFIEKFGHKIKHVHVSDNWGDKDTHLPLGEGNINWRKVLDALDDAGFEGWLVIESYTEMYHNIKYLRDLL
jgi:sugar phosphate isomerase/epimerase